jgi:CHAD domain-containing protein
MQPGYVRLKEIKPALAGYISDSLSMMNSAPLTDEEMVHDVRVFMKKSRAALTLIGPQLDQELFVRDIHSLKEAGRLLRHWREYSVFRKSVKALRKQHPEIFKELQDNEKIAELLRKPVPSAETTPEFTSEQENIADVLKKTGYRIRFQSMKQVDPGQLLKGLEATYISCIDAFVRARNNSKPSNLHEFRKKAKTFLYQLYFFRPLNPPMVKEIEKRLEIMLQNIGRFHDMHQLVKILNYKYSGQSGSSSLDELVLIIREMQDRYLAKTWPIAYKIFYPGQKLVNILGYKILSI